MGSYNQSAAILSDQCYENRHGFCPNSTENDIDQCECECHEKRKDPNP